MVKFSYSQNEKFTVIMFLIICDIQKHCLRCHQKFLLPVFFQKCILAFSGWFIYLKTELFYQASNFHSSERMCCSEIQEEATLLSTSSMGGLCCDTHRCGCHKSHVFSRALTTWPWLTSERDWTGSYLHGNGDATVCRGKLKRFTVMPECEMLTFTPPTHLTAFGSSLHKGQLQINQSGYVGSKCLFVIQQNSILTCNGTLIVLEIFFLPKIVTFEREKGKSTHKDQLSLLRTKHQVLLTEKL